MGKDEAARFNPWRDLRGLPRGVWILFATTLVNRAGTMVLPFLVLYLTGGLGFTPARAGAYLALYGVASIVAAPIAGRLCDRVGSAPVMAASLLVSGGTLLVFPLAGRGLTVAALVILLSVASEAFRPASLSITSDLVEPGRRRSAYALSRLAINLGMSVGPAVGGFLAERSFVYLFLVDGVTSLAAFVLLLVSGLGHLQHRGAEEGEEGAPNSRAGFAAALGDRRLSLFLLAILPVAFVFFQHVSAMPLYLVRDLGFSKSTYGLLFTVNTLLIVLLEVPLNLAMRDWSHRSSLSLGAFLTAAGFGATALATGVPGVLATVVVWTFGEMILFPSLPAYVAEIAPPGAGGTYMGLFTMTFGLAFSAAPWVGTTLLERLGGSGLWGAMFLLGLVSVVTFSRLPSPGPRSTGADPRA